MFQLEGVVTCQDTGFRDQHSSVSSQVWKITCVLTVKSMNSKE